MEELQLEATNVAKPLAIRDDKEYLEEYFGVCDLLQKKFNLLTAEAKEGDASNEGKFAELSAVIQKRDKAFWAAVEESLRKGGRFAMEDIALAYGLDTFEKRTMLYLLYRLFSGKLDSISLVDIPKALDINNSIIDRICNVRYFGKESRLAKAKLIEKDILPGVGIAIGLTAKLITTFPKMLLGEKVELRFEEEASVSSCEEIGYIKEPEHTIDSVVLEDDVKDKIRLFVDSSKKGGDGSTGAGKMTRIGKGMVFLFFGPPGTGKSMLAEAVASMLGKRILVVEYPKITSRWFGETDKKISQSFRAAKEQNLMLLMDEADSLLYNRSYAGQEHDIRFVNEMLQELDRFDGVVALTTNMDDLLDPALERRVTFRVKLEEPTERMRAAIWKAHIPANITMSGDVDFAVLAKQYEFSGGYIKNAVQTALRRILLENKETMTMDDLLFGAKMEKDGIFNKQKRGKIGFVAVQ